MQTHKDLKVWQESMTLVVDLYKVAATFPEEEKYGIVSQIKRAGVSIPTNIAEGYGRMSEKELIRFLYISLGSASEVETLLIISKELTFIGEEQFSILIDKNSGIIKMLSSLIRKVKIDNGMSN